MAYIRPLSNPEGLYIFGHRDGVEIGGPHGSFNYQVSYEDWNGLIDAYNNDDSIVGLDGLTDGETFSYGSLALRTEKRGENFKTILSHEDGWEIEMWDVTWLAIVR